MILIIINLQIVSSASIELNYPEIVDVNEEFNIDIKLIEFEEDVYDVKIDVINGDEKRISKIYNENSSSWGSSYYYINDVIANSSKSASLKMIIYEYDDKAIINVKVRSSKNAVKSFNNYPISIINPDSKLSDLKPQENYSQVSSDIENQEQNKNSGEKVEQEIKQEQENKETLITSQGISQIEQESNNSNIIKLQAKNIKSDIYMSNQEKVKQYSVYLFFIFLLFLVAFLILKKIR